MKSQKLILMMTASATAILLAAPVHAQSDAWMGEVMITGAPYCPKTSAEMSGQLVSIQQNQALFSLLNVTYGGNGTTNFALPDQRGRVALHTGQGPGLGNYAPGQAGGTENVVLSVAQMPNHLHTANLVAVNVAPSIDNPTGAALADFPDDRKIYNNQNQVNAPMAKDSVKLFPAGGSQPFSNLSPYQVLRSCVFTQGIYPSRN